MMKGQIKYFVFTLLTFLILTDTTYALNNITIEGDSKVTLGENITYNINVSNLESENNMIGISGTINYDSNYLELVNTNLVNKYGFTLYDNEPVLGNVKIAGFTLSEGFRTSAYMFNITFKAINLGHTNIEAKDFDLADIDDNLIKLNDSYKELDIIEKEEIKPIIEEKEEIIVSKKEEAKVIAKKETKKEIKEETVKNTKQTTLGKILSILNKYLNK